MNFRLFGFAGCISGLIATNAMANVVGSDLQNFVPAASRIDGATVHDALTIGQGRFGLGLFVDYAANTLPYFKEADGTTRDRDKSLNDSVTTLDLSLVYGLTSFWDVSMAVPFIVAQQVGELDETHGYYEKKGLTSYRMGSKVRLLQAGRFALGLVGHAVYNRVEDNPYSDQKRWPSTSLELATSLDLRVVTLMVNGGYRWRSGEPGEDILTKLPVERYGDQIIYSVGAVIPIGSSWAAIGEVYGARNWDEFSSESPRSTSISESVLGLRYSIRPDLQLHFGGGAELQHAISSADVRGYAGIRWTIGGEEKAPKATEIPMVQTLPKPDLVIDLDEVFFKFDSIEIRDPKGYQTMQRLSEILREQATIERVVIEGHTCDLGSEAYNQRLSDRRAITVEKWLTEHYGIDQKKLHSIGWGEWRPKMSNDSTEHRRLNRRVTFRVYFAKTGLEPSKLAGSLENRRP